jgi:ankyrin repeat protein
MSGGDALIAACRNKDEAEALHLIKNGADVNVVYESYTKLTPALFAANHGLQDTLTALIGAKADVKFATNTGETALHAALSSKHEGCAQLLIQHGADVNAVFESYTECTPALFAANRGLRDALTTLIHAKADVKFATKAGETALHAAASSSQEGCEDCAQLLIEHGVDVNYAMHACGETALTRAVAYRRYDAVYVLLDAEDVDVKIHNNKGDDALQLALSRDATCVYTLLCKGSDIKREHEKTAAAVAEYGVAHAFIEEYHRRLTKSLELEVVVDTRVGLGENGLYQEPLEVVLEYCGLRMKADQVVNVSIDGADRKRLLIPQHRARNARYWFLLSPQAPSTRA